MNSYFYRLMPPEIEIIEAGADKCQASAALIAVHGRGQNAGDMLSLCKEFPVEGYHIVAPESRKRSWYPRNFMAPWARNQDWFETAVVRLRLLVSELEDSGIPSEKIYLMGFSQGACIILDFASQYARGWGGLMAFTGGLPGEDISLQRYRGDFNGTKIFMGTGANDAHVPLQRAKRSKLVLEELGAEVHLKIFKDKLHGIDPEEIRLAREWVFSDVDVLS